MNPENLESYIFGFFAAAVIYGAMELMPLLLRRLRTAKVGQAVGTRAAEIISPPATFAFDFVEVPGEDAATAFERAKREGQRVALLIAGGAQTRLALATMMQYRKPSTADYLRRAAALPNPYGSRFTLPATAEVPALSPMQEPPFLVRSQPDGFKPVVTLAFFDAARAADIPAHLKLGGWNGIVEADVFVALLRKWQRDYGAELVAVSSDAMDVRVSRAPSTKSEAMALAREHKQFCPGEGTLKELAEDLMHLKWWHFYWD
jgi:hypothetical protein